MKQCLKVYLENFEMEQLVETARRNNRSASNMARQLIVNGVTQPDKPVQPPKQVQPDVCPTCHEDKDELGNPSFVVNGNRTYYCRLCGANGKW